MNLQSYRCKYWHSVKAFFLGKWAGHSINRDCSLLVMCRCLLNGSTERTLLLCTDNCVPLLVLALHTCADAIQSLSSCKNQLTADPGMISCRHHQKQTLQSCGSSEEGTSRSSERSRLISSSSHGFLRSLHASFLGGTKGPEKMHESEKYKQFEDEYQLSELN